MTVKTKLEQKFVRLKVDLVLDLNLIRHFFIHESVETKEIKRFFKATETIESPTRTLKIVFQETTLVIRDDVDKSFKELCEYCMV